MASDDEVAASVVETRLSELAALSDGWLNGQGSAPKAVGSTWLAQMFATHFDAQLPLPYLYPTPAGGVQAEWRSGPFDASLEIDLQRHTGTFHCLDLATEAAVERDLHLDVPADWAWLSAALRELLRPRNEELDP